MELDYEAHGLLQEAVDRGMMGEKTSAQRVASQCVADGYHSLTPTHQAIYYLQVMPHLAKLGRERKSRSASSACPTNEMKERIMTEHYDDDGNSTILTDEDRTHITAEIAQLDAELMQCRESPLFRDIRQRRTHLVDELEAGRRLSLPEDNRTWYDFQILPRQADLGGGWRLCLLKDGVEAGGGVFPVEQDETGSAAWWKSLGDDETALWLARATVPTSAGAYLAYRTDQAWHDAAQEAGDWLDSRPAN